MYARGFENDGDAVSLELANEKFLDGGNPDGLLGQFASTQGYSELIAACAKFPALSDFFDKGATEDVDAVLKELGQVIAKAPKDIASTATALRDLAKGQDFLMITNGGA